MTMTMHVSLPCPGDLATDPELAVLALLDATLAIAVQALIASNPELLYDDDDLTKPPRVIAAQQIVVLHRELSDALQEYRTLIPPCEFPGEDIPF
jgi:hypothetical protein